MNLQGVVTRDVLCGIFFLIVAAVAVHETSDTSIWTAAGPKEGFFPLVLGISLAIMSIWLILSGLFRRSTGSVAETETRSEQETAPRKQGRVILYISCFIGYAVLLASIGFILDSLLLLTVLLRFAEYQSWRTTITISIASVALGYLIFRVLLAVPLPNGRFF